MTKARVLVLALLFATSTSASAQAREIPAIRTADHRFDAGESILYSVAGAATTGTGVYLLALPGRHDLNLVGAAAVGVGGLSLGLGIVSAVLTRRDALLVERGQARWDSTPWHKQELRVAAAALYLFSAGFAGHATYHLVVRHIQSGKCTTQRACVSPLEASDYGIGVTEYALAAAAFTMAVVTHVKARARTDVSFAPTVGYRSAGFSAMFVW